MVNEQKDGHKQGLWVEPDEDGEWVGHYERGKKEGTWSHYDGRSLGKVAWYVDDLKQGPGYRFGPDGNLLLAVEFEKDRIHGEVRFFSSDGQHIATYLYVYDKLDRVALYVLHDESPPKHETYLPEF
jgi:uncharacterized protein